MWARMPQGHRVPSTGLRVVGFSWGHSEDIPRDGRGLGTALNGTCRNGRGNATPSDTQHKGTFRVTGTSSVGDPGVTGTSRVMGTMGTHQVMGTQYGNGDNSRVTMTQHGDRDQEGVGDQQGTSVTMPG